MRTVINWQLKSSALKWCCNSVHISMSGYTTVLFSSSGTWQLFRKAAVSPYFLSGLAQKGNKISNEWVAVWSHIINRWLVFNMYLIGINRKYCNIQNYCGALKWHIKPQGQRKVVSTVVLPLSLKEEENLLQRCGSSQWSKKRGKHSYKFTHIFCTASGGVL